jgi:glycerophosphoryl diester phosphodiesterase
LQHDGILAFAHRGGALDFPENTMTAFQGAVDLGFAYLETDAYCTRDGVLLSFHDDRLDRVTDGAGRIAELDWAQIKQAKVGGVEPIPLLADVLTSWPGVKVNIDAKHDEAVEPLAHLLRDLAVVDRVCVGSFSGRRIKRLRALCGDALCVSMGPLSVARLRFAAWGAPTGGFFEACAQVPLTQYGATIVDRRFVVEAHQRGLQVHVWTIDDETEMERLIDLGVDGLMTDRPKTLRSVLLRRNLWPVASKSAPPVPESEKY